MRRMCDIVSLGARIIGLRIKKFRGENNWRALERGNKTSPPALIRKGLIERCAGLIADVDGGVFAVLVDFNSRSTANTNIDGLLSRLRNNSEPFRFGT